MYRPIHPEYNSIFQAKDFSEGTKKHLDSATHLNQGGEQLNKGGSVLGGERILNQGGQQLLLAGDSEEDKTPIQSSGSSTNSGMLRVYQYILY